MTDNTFFEETREQSVVKSAIVSKYFWAWAKVIMPSAKRRAGRIAYLDLFAGPGRYSDGTKSTPLLVLEQAIADPPMAQMLVTVFNDKDEANCRSLEAAIQDLSGVERLAHRPVVLNQEVGSEMVRQVQQAELIPALVEQGPRGGRSLIPTLFFVDPWGYKGLSLQLVNAVVKDWACECVFFFNYNRVNMGLGNEAVAPHMNALFGPECADALRSKIENIAPEDREAAIVEELSRALNPARDRFVLPFRFRSASGSRTSHHLIFVSKNFLGYHIMKGVMARESSTHEQGVARFEYNPADRRFPLLFDLSRPLDELEGMLCKQYSTKTISFKDMYESHSVGLPYTDSNYKQVLKDMESRGRITARKADGSKRRPKTFADDVLITFK